MINGFCIKYNSESCLKFDEKNGCTLCKDGFYLKNYQCFEYPKNCLTFTKNIGCTLWNIRYFAKNDIGCVLCTSKYYAHNGKCINK